MDHHSPQPKGSDGNIMLQIGEIMVEPDDQLGRRGSNNVHRGSSSKLTVDAPEKKLTLFALQLALLEKLATALGAMGFIWATVVLLGAYAVDIQSIDFWFITAILIVEAARIFSRSHEIEWQHQSTWTIADASVHSYEALKSSSNFVGRIIRGISGSISDCPSQTSKKPKEKTDEAIPNNHLAPTRSREVKEKIEEDGINNPSRRTWKSSEVPLLPYIGWAFLSKNISRLFYWLQFLTALACMGLSITRLVQLSFDKGIPSQGETKNQKSALYIFYGLALAEAFFSLLGKAYWEWTITHRKLLEEVDKDCDIGMISLRRFFYDAYAECINHSIFGGLKLDLVTFAMELLASLSRDEQLIGAGILQKFSTNPNFSYDTLLKIGTNTPVIERLIEMLNWKSPQEAEIRRAAAEILSILSGKKQNSLRVAGIPGAMESISSLIHAKRSSNGMFDEIGEKVPTYDKENYEYSAFSVLGLTILKNLARDHDNCDKIGKTRGLLLKFVDLTHTGEELLKNSHDTNHRIVALKLSMQVLKLLVRTSGSVGKHLRREIVEIVFTISNIRKILRLGGKFPKLQRLGIKIVTSLSFDVEAREKIGSTGGFLKLLFQIFFQKPNPEEENKLGVSAGEAIAVLAMESEKNCSRILDLKELEALIRSIKNEELRINPARILRHLCKFAGDDCHEKLKEVSATAPMVLKAIMLEENKRQEVMLGLATQVFRFMTPEEARIKFEETGIDENQLAKKLLEILQKYPYPPFRVPRMRRFTIELAILMMTNNKATIATFRNLGMENELEILRDTTSEIESFNIFSGTIGLSRHNVPIHSLVDNALQLLEQADG